MGKRKSKKKVMKKKKPTVDKVYDCPFCNHRKVVECEMNTKLNLGTLKCRICGVTYQIPINHLTHPIDVFSEWIDECAQVNDPANQMEEMDSVAHMLDPDELERALATDEYGDDIHRDREASFPEHHGIAREGMIHDDIKNEMEPGLLQDMNYRERSSSPLTMNQAVARVANNEDDFGERKFVPLHS